MTAVIPPRETSELVIIYDNVVRALAMGHAGERANEVWRTHRDRIEAELLSRGFWVRNTDEARDEAHREHEAHEQPWDDTLHGFSTASLVDMLDHSVQLLAQRPESWTDFQYGASCIWTERLRMQLIRRGWILDPEVAFNAAYFEVGVRQARQEPPSELQVWARAELARVEGTSA